MQVGGSRREAIFLSYAWEDVALMRWLAGRLATAGYAVWCDQWRLFGGLDWPSEIDDAIKLRTAKMIALVSAHSLEKPNPKREWTLALTLERERNEKGFLIPLNVDGQPPSAFPWLLADRQYIPSRRWDEGLRGLLEALAEYRVPRVIAEHAAELTLAPLGPPGVLRDEPEDLFTNRLPVLTVPDVLQRYRPLRQLTWTESIAMRRVWPAHPGPDGLIYAFGDPPVDPAVPVPMIHSGAIVWIGGRSIDEKPARHLVKPILRDAVIAHGSALGLDAWPEVGGLRFPRGLLPEDTVFFRHPSGKAGKCHMVNDRLVGRPRAFRYHIAFVPFIQHVGDDRFVVELKLRLWTTAPDGTPYTDKAANARRRYIAKRWFNAEWRNRIMGIGAFLAGAGQRLLQAPEVFTVALGGTALATIASRPIRVAVTPSLDEGVLEAVRRRLPRRRLPGHDVGTEGQV